MLDINLTDVTIHMDSAVDVETRHQIEIALREQQGVVSVHMPENRQHLVLVEYNPAVNSSSTMLETVSRLAGQAQMIGL